MKLVLIGGFCEMIELCQRAGHEVIGFTDPKPQDFSVYGVKYLGQDDVLKDMDGDFGVVVTPDKHDLRKRIYEKVTRWGKRFESVIATTADVSVTAEIGEGTVIAEHAIVTAQTKIGRFVKLNTAAKVTHECEIGDYATIAPSAVVLGRVKIGEGAYIGANATILPGLRIGANAIIGAGAVVTHDVPDNETWVGIPAREMKK